MQMHILKKCLVTSTVNNMVSSEFDIYFLRAKIRFESIFFKENNCMMLYFFI